MHASKSPDWERSITIMATCFRYAEQQTKSVEMNVDLAKSNATVLSMVSFQTIDSKFDIQIDYIILMLDLHQFLIHNNTQVYIRPIGMLQPLNLTYHLLDRREKIRFLLHSILQPNDRSQELLLQSCMRSRPRPAHWLRIQTVGRNSNRLSKTDPKTKRQPRYIE